MHRTIEIAVPAKATGSVLTELEALEGVVQLSVVRGGSIKPPGDVVTVHVLNREVDAVLTVAAQARQSGPVSVSTAEVQSILDENVAAPALAAAGVIAPAFEPVAKLAVGLVRGSWYSVRRALIA